MYNYLALIILRTNFFIDNVDYLYSMPDKKTQILGVMLFFFIYFPSFPGVLITVTNNMRDNVTADKCDNDNNAINNDNNSYFIPIKFL